MSFVSLIHKPSTQYGFTQIFLGWVDRFSVMYQKFTKLGMLLNVDLHTFNLSCMYKKAAIESVQVYSNRVQVFS
jgi:hypothetical protein